MLSSMETWLQDYKTRVQEAKQADFLFAMNKLYPHAWYCRWGAYCNSQPNTDIKMPISHVVDTIIFRRFFKPVQVSKEPGPHFGMGLDCYVQWSSPIRRLTDLQVCLSTYSSPFVSEYAKVICLL